MVRDEISYQGLQIKEVAAMSNVSISSFLSYIDARERTPAVDVAVRIAQALGVTVEYLVTGKDSKASDTLPEKYKPLKQTLDDLLLLPPEQLIPIQAMIRAAAEMELKKNEKHSEII